MRIRDRMLRHTDWILFTGCVVFFLAFPTIDLKVSGLFYDHGFGWAKNEWIRAIYWLFAKIHFLVLLILLILLVFYSVKSNVNARRASIYLFLVLLLGPGLAVNALLKNNSVGRPRPVQTIDFGGEAAFAPVFHYSGACKRNCSFVSGHAAIGFYLMAFFWIRRKKAWLYAGIALGSSVGLVRIMQGGHYLSDVIFAGWTVYFVCVVLSMLLPKPTQQSTQ